MRITKAWKKGPHGRPVLKQPKSARAKRTISLSDDVVHALGKPGPRGQLLFPGQFSGGHLWYAGFRENVWNPAVVKAMDSELCAREGLAPLTRRPTPHDLRHSHASWLVAAGVPLPHVQVRLGHESIQTTVNTYTHLLPDAHVEMAHVMSVTLSGVRPLRQIES